MKKLIAVLITVAGIAVLSALPAQAAISTPPAGWLKWLMPTGTVCVETGGSAIAARAAADWNRTDMVVVAKSRCDGYTRMMTVKFEGYNAPNTSTCGYATSVGGYYERTVRGARVLVAAAPVIRINYATNLRTACRSTSTKMLHLFSHELGHIWGLAHNRERSVVAEGRPYAWVYSTPTSIDHARINRRY